MFASTALSRILSYLSLVILPGIASRGIQLAPLEKISLPLTHMVSSFPPILTLFFTTRVLKAVFFVFFSPFTVAQASYTGWAPKPLGHHLSISSSLRTMVSEYLFSPFSTERVKLFFFPATSRLTSASISFQLSRYSWNSTCHSPFFSLGITAISL